MERIRILLAHRDEDLARKLQIEVNQNHQMEWGGWVTSQAEALAVCAVNPPQVLLLGLRLQDASGLETLHSLGTMQSSAKIIAFSDSLDPELIKSMLRAGARGYILANESLPQLLALIPAVLRGHTILSMDIIPLLVQ